MVHLIITSRGQLRLASLLQAGLFMVGFAQFVIRWPSQCLTLSIQGRRRDGAVPEALLPSA